MWPNARMPTLTVHRDRGWTDRFRRYRILVDGAEVGRLRQGERLAVEVAPGPHEVEARIDWCGSRVLEFECADEAPVEVVVRSAVRGWRLLFPLRAITDRKEDYIEIAFAEEPPGGAAN